MHCEPLQILREGMICYLCHAFIVRQLGCRYKSIIGFVRLFFGRTDVFGGDLRLADIHGHRLAVIYRESEYVAPYRLD